MTGLQFAIKRVPGNPIVRCHMDPRMGGNVNGPSAIVVPEWIERPLGRYYLYFGHHFGTYIRLAFADSIAGPWSTYEPGVLELADTPFVGHIASPDVHVDHERREIRMYCHGPLDAQGEPQGTRVALSRDGRRFEMQPQLLGAPYMRMFWFPPSWYGLGMPGILYRSKDGLRDFCVGPTLFSSRMRHSAVTREGEKLLIFYTNVGDCPEAIIASELRLTSDWLDWRPSRPMAVLQPEEEYEGACLRLAPSRRGAASMPVRELRDPYILRDGHKRWLFYSVAGEQGIAVAGVTWTAEEKIQ